MIRWFETLNSETPWCGFLLEMRRQGRLHWSSSLCRGVERRVQHTSSTPEGNPRRVFARYTSPMFCARSTPLPKASTVSSEALLLASLKHATHQWCQIQYHFPCSLRTAAAIYFFKKGISTIRTLCINVAVWKFWFAGTGNSYNREKYCAYSKPNDEKI